VLVSSIMLRRHALAALAALALPAGACKGRGQGDGEARPSGPIRVVFKHQPLWGDPAPFRDLLTSFEREHPGVRVVTEPLPNASDIVHQFFLTALEGGARDFDVFVADVIWIPEFARAGWIADLSSALSPDALRRDFLPGAALSALFEGRTYAVPWYIDVGLLYHRTDLVPRAPRTYDELIDFAERVTRAGAAPYGYVWQGRQYEGLVCNAYETIWGHGGSTMSGERVLLDTPAARAGLAYLRSLIARGVSPTYVTSMAEEEARRAFQEGKSAFMRNWPYAWNEAQREGSPVRGKVGISALPTTGGEPGYGALGGYHLVLNARSPAYKRAAAHDFIAHMTSPEANLVLATAYGRNPPRRAPYASSRITSSAPLIARLLPMLERAKPRPLTPYYPMITDTLQAEFSAAITGIRSPDEALGRAQSLIDHMTGVRP